MGTTGAKGPEIRANSLAAGQESTQRTVFEEVVQPLVDCTFQGYNATVFAYGPSPPPRTSRAQFAPSCPVTGARARPFGSLGALALR